MDKTNSLAIYPDNVHCYGCGFHLNNLNEALAFLLGTTEAEAREVADKYTNETLDAYRVRAAEDARTDPLAKALADVYHTMLMSGGPRQQRIHWMFDRGLDPTRIVDARLGHDGQRFVIPVFDADGNLLTLRYRRDDEYLPEDYPKYLGLTGRNGNYVYPEPLIAADTRNFLVLPESELCSLLLWQHNIPAAAITNGAGQLPKLPGLIKERYPHIEALILAGDNDEAGEAGMFGYTTEKGNFIPGAVQTGEELGFRMYRLNWKEVKDVTEAIGTGQLDPTRWREYVTAIA